jgi:hypothetical protein
MTMKWASFNYLEFQLPDEAVRECHHQGACDADVEYWQAKLNLNLDREKMILELKEYGAWTENELNALGNDELEQKLIWIAAGNIQDEENQ